MAQMLPSLFLPAAKASWKYSSMVSGYSTRKAKAIYPDLARVREMRKVIDAKLENLEPAPADD